MGHSFQVSQAVLCMHLRNHMRGNYAPRLFPSNSITLTTPRRIILYENSSWYLPSVTAQHKWAIGLVKYVDTLKKWQRNVIEKKKLIR